MPIIDIIDEMYVVEARDVVRERCCDEGQWAIWFPDLTLGGIGGPGPKGVRWDVSGALVGTVEVWLEEYGDSTIVHTYVRAEPAKRVGDSRRTQTWATRRYALPLKAHLLAVKFAMEAGRELGTPRVPLGERVVSPPTGPQTSAEGGRTGTGGETTKGQRDGRTDDLEHRDRR
ncbi:MAG: polyketide cyclase / dehydrase and lipid transport [Actinomycetota bacterium]|nr:polyketide cyclase / dehydrase and lipid transport [Actinomycetota bacterium]